MTDRVVNGDFHVIKMDGLFHVVFRPDSDPEWFRIVATFYTYERAWCYCDIERVSVWEESGDTGREETAGLRTPPIGAAEESPLASLDGISGLVRAVYDGADHVPPHPVEPPVLDPDENERPEDYNKRLYAEAIAKMADAPDEPEPEPETGEPIEIEEVLTEKQERVLAYLKANANPLGLVNATYRQMADDTKVSRGSISYMIETLERKRLVKIIEADNGKTAPIFKVLNVIVKPPTCKSCGGPRAVGSASQCRECYEGITRLCEVKA